MGKLMKLCLNEKSFVFTDEIVRALLEIEEFGASLNSVGLNRSRFSDLQVPAPLVCIL